MQKAGDIARLHAKSMKASSRSQARLDGDNRAVAAKVKRGKRGKRGPRGYTGPQGSQGPQGPAGPAGSATIYTETSATYYVSSGDSGSYTATCTSGGKAISGSFYNDSTYYAWLNTSLSKGNQWLYDITNNSGVYGTNVFFVTTCAV